jgi:hypothetical protein
MLTVTAPIREEQPCAVRSPGGTVLLSTMEWARQMCSALFPIGIARSNGTGVTFCIDLSLGRRREVRLFLLAENATGNTIDRPTTFDMWGGHAARLRQKIFRPYCMMENARCADCTSRMAESDVLRSNYTTAFFPQLKIDENIVATGWVALLLWEPIT